VRDRIGWSRQISGLAGPGVGADAVEDHELLPDLVRQSGCQALKVVNRIWMISAATFDSPESGNRSVIR
jgi:hypothetical protein